MEHGWGAKPLHKAIEDSRKLLEWGDDWDGEGSKGYTAETLALAHDLLTRMYDAWHQIPHAEMIPVCIYAGPSGGIDITWEYGGRDILAHVSPDPTATVGYFGNEGGGYGKDEPSIGGYMRRSEDNEWLLMWLTSKQGE